MDIPELREQIDLFLSQSGSREQVDSILGSWIMVAHDIERSVGTLAIKSWSNSASFIPEPGKVILGELLIDGLAEFLERSFLEPLAVYADLYPVAPPPLPPPQKKGGKIQVQNIEASPRARVEEEEESETDRKARLRVSALGGLQWILGKNYFECIEPILITVFKITWAKKPYQIQQLSF
jgi:E3 ubiquitin-protein ligase listerin